MSFNTIHLDKYDKFYHDKSDSDFKFYLKIKWLEAPSLSFSNADVCVNVYYMHKLALWGGGIK